MPGMFSRRRTSSQPPIHTPVSSAAASAASQAYLKSSASSANLSAAAAAAALRSATTSPEPIGSIVTKRMIRRGSQSSIGSGSIMGTPRGGMMGRGGLGLSRQDSQSSMTMTERTFRSPSPSMSSFGGRPSPARLRSASVEPPMRVTSPSPKPGQRSSSFLPTGRGQRLSSLQQVQEHALERQDSQTSINFSRPMSPPLSRATSPAPSRMNTNGARFGTPAASNGPAPDLPNAAPTTLVKKKKKVTAATSEGGHLATATTTRSPQVAALPSNGRTTPAPAALASNGRTTPAPAVLASNGRTTPAPAASAAQAAALRPTSAAGTAVVTPKKKTKPAAPAINTNVAPPPRNPARLSPAESTPPQPQSPRASGALSKQPSVVREEPETDYVAALPSAPAATGGLSSPQKKKKVASVRSASQTITTSAGPALQYVAPNAQQMRSASLDIPRSQSGTRLRSSLSPPRTARFSNGSIVDPATGAIHNPLPRSVSPAKSALKRSPAPSLRAVSPATNAGPLAPRPAASDTSDARSIASSDGGTKPTKKKKKSTRVSFDDAATTVLASSAAPQSPQHNALPPTPMRRSLSPSVAAADESDETMQPRPALPSFGSVRGRKDPTSTKASPEIDDASAQGVAEISNMPDTAHILSTNGLANGNAEQDRMAEQTIESTPLAVPHSLTHVDGAGYTSDASEYSQEVSGVHDFQPVAHPLETLTQHTAPETTTMRDGSATTASGLIAVPDIAILPASPGLESLEDGPSSEPAVPGIAVLPATPRNGEDITGDMDESKAVPADSEKFKEQKYSAAVLALAAQIHAEQTQAGHSAAGLGIENESDEDEYDAATPTGERHSPLLEAIHESETDEKLSDAAEDLSDHEGFASLNAMVKMDSPVVKPPPAAISTPREIPPNAPFAQTHQQTGSGDWTEATAYWSGLSRKRKEELERAAAVDSEDDVLPVAPAAKPMKKKTKPIVKQSNPTQPTGQAQVQPAAIVAPPGGLVAAQARGAPPAPAAPLAETRAAPLKKTMRGTPIASPADGETHMRMSLRDSQGASPRRMSVDAPKSAPRKKIVRPASMGNLPGTSVPVSAPAATPQSQATRTSSNPVSSSLAKTTTNGSDSESSFKKGRRGSSSAVDNAGRHSMKRSMRAGSVERASERPLSPTPNGVDGAANLSKRRPVGAQAVERASERPLSPTPQDGGPGQLGARALSPTGSFMGRSRMRSETIDDTPTMRGRNSKTATADPKSPSRFSMSGFSRSPKTTPVAAAQSKPKTSTFKSRFNNSDSDDDRQTSSRFGFRSRFVDSDDEDSPVGPPRYMPADLAPVRGIPARRGQDEASTDLDDSEEERHGRAIAKEEDRPKTMPVVPALSDVDKAMAAARRNVAAQLGNEPGAGRKAESPARHLTNGQPPTGAQSPIDGTPGKRRGLLGSVLIRKRTDSTQSIPLAQSASMNDIGKMAIPSVPTLQSRNPPTLARSGTGMSSRGAPTYARPGTGMSSNNTAYLARAGIPVEAMMFDDIGTPEERSQSSAYPNWPLSQRPATSDGLGEREKVTMPRTLRPDIGRRQSSRLGGARPEPVFSEKTGKKKKFSGLRKFFGLND